VPSLGVSDFDGMARAHAVGFGDFLVDNASYSLSLAKDFYEHFRKDISLCFFFVILSRFLCQNILKIALQKDRSHFFLEKGYIRSKNYCKLAVLTKLTLKS
jgi:hypothetical protein